MATINVETELRVFCSNCEYEISGVTLKTPCVEERPAIEQVPNDYPGVVSVWVAPCWNCAKEIPE